MDTQYYAEIAKLTDAERTTALILAIDSYEKLGGLGVTTEEIIDRAEVFESFLTNEREE